LDGNGRSGNGGVLYRYCLTLYLPQRPLVFQDVIIATELEGVTDYLRGMELLDGEFSGVSEEQTVRVIGNVVSDMTKEHIEEVRKNLLEGDALEDWEKEAIKKYDGFGNLVFGAMGNGGGITDVYGQSPTFELKPLE